MACCDVCGNALMIWVDGEDITEDKLDDPQIINPTSIIIWDADLERRLSIAQRL